MVFFTCNHCGESLKKNSVDKHYAGPCRHPKFLTCVDCMKDFRGEEYAAHTKCITEDEKYSAKGYTSRPPSVKGEVKQQSWIELLKNVYENKKDLPEDQRRLLNQLLRHNNVPQKQTKFVNFVKNISPRTQKMTIDMLWTSLESERNAQKEKEVKPVSGKSEGENGKDNGEIGNVGSQNGTAPQQNKKNKKNKNAKQHGNSQDVTSDNDINGADGMTGKAPSSFKKKNRDKHMKDGDFAVELETADSSEKHSKSKKKRKHEEEQTPCDDISALKKNKLNDTGDGDEEKSAKKFNWCNVIVKVLESTDDKELSVKRLRKKVLAEFSSTGKTVNESVYAKFTKKLSKIPVVLLRKDKAKLKM